MYGILKSKHTGVLLINEAILCIRKEECIGFYYGYILNTFNTHK